MAYAVGKISPEMVEPVSEHVDSCADCQATLAGTPSDDDTLVTELRIAANQPPLYDERELHEAARAAEAAVADEITQRMNPTLHNTVHDLSVSAGGPAAPEATVLSDPGRPRAADPDPLGLIELARDPADGRLETPSAEPGAAPMSASIAQFTKGLESCGLLTADELAAFQAAQLGGKPAGDAQELAQALVRHGKLTKYQATQLLQGKARRLLFGEYLVIDKLGAGGMGQVFRARHRRMKRVVAIKVLPPAAVKTPDAVRRFQREVEAAARLDHPNIVTAYDAGEANGQHFLVMQYVDGRDLSSLVKEHGPLPVAAAVDYIAQTARGLAFAHGEGVIHRDIKPANLLVDKKGTVKILDMGLARLADDAAIAEGLTQSGQVMGTADYMAPEQAFDTHHVDARADIYSLGCTLYRLLTGESIYGGESMIQKVMAHREAPIPDLCAKRAEVPPALGAVFQRMVAKQPEQRYATMADVYSALEAVRASSLRLKVASGDLSVSQVTSSTSVDLNEPTAPWQTGGGESDSALHNTLGGVADAGTEPKSEVRLAPAASGGKPPWRRRRTLIAAGGAGGLCLLLGVIVTVYNSRHEKVAEIHVDGTDAVPISVPPGGSVAVKNVPDKAPGEEKPAPASRDPQEAATPRKMPPSAISSASAPGATGSASAPPPAVAPFDAQQARAHQQAWARHLGTTVEQTNTLGAKLVLIPPGTFLMGSTPEQVELSQRIGAEAQLDPKYIAQLLAREVPQHRVTLSQPFVIGATEVTVGQFKEFVAATKYVTEAERFGFGNAEGTTPDDKVTTAMRKMNWRTPGYTVTDDFPVTQVTWNDAVQFCNWLSEQEHLQPCYRLDAKAGWVLISPGELQSKAATGNPGYRLPTEAEFEFANRAGTSTLFSFGDDPAPLGDHAWFNRNAGGSRAVGQKLPNAFGLYDMLGNLRQWCQDVYGDYSDAPAVDPAGAPPGTARVQRGGTRSQSPLLFRASQRHIDSATYRSGSDGFRLARTLPQALPGAAGFASAPPLADGRGALAEKPQSAKTKTLRDLAEWAIGQGGKVQIEKTTFDKVSSLPQQISQPPAMQVHFDGLKTFSDASLQKMAEFPVPDGIHLNGASVTGEGFADFRGRKPAWLDLSGCPITPAGWDCVVALGPIKQSLSAAYCRLDDRAAGLLAAHPELKHLSLAGNPVTDAGLASLKPLVNLEALALYDCRITDAGLANLRGMIRLVTLDVSQTKVTDTGLATLESLPSLKSVNLTKTKVTAAGVAKLHKALPKCMIEWDGAPATPLASIPAAIVPGAANVDPERRAAEWVLGLGGNVAVTVKVDGKGPEVTVRKLEELPAGRFSVTYIYAGAWNPPGRPPGKQINDADLENLRGLKAINSLYIIHGRGPSLGDAGLATIAELLTLKQLGLTNWGQVTDAGLARLAQLKELTGLTMATTTRYITDDGLRPLAALRLTSLGVHQTPLTERGAEIIAQQWPQLTHLDLPGRALTAGAAKHLAALTKLTYLGFIGSPELRDEQLAHLAPLKQLRVLGLDDCKNISDAGLDYLAALPGLTSIDLRKTKVTAAGVAKLQKALPKCQIAWDGAPANQVASIPAAVVPVAANADPERRAAEWALGLGGNVAVTVKVDGKGPEVTVRKLEELPAGRFTAVVVTIGAPKPPGKPAGKTLTDADLENLRGLTAIRSLSITYGRGPALTDAGLDAIAELRSLTQLRLGDTQVTDAGLARLGQLNGVTSLYLVGSMRISDEGLRSLAALPLTNLHLHITPLTERAVAIIAQQWPRLTYLDLPGRALTAEAAKHLAELPKLKELGFAGSPELRDEQLAHLASLKPMRTLGLIDCAGISDAGLEHLAALPSLTSIDLRKTKVTAAGVAKLQKALPKCQIDWDGTPAAELTSRDAASMPLLEDAAAPAPAGWALELDGQKSRIEVPKWKFAGDTPLTLELWAARRESAAPSPAATLAGDGEGRGGIVLTYRNGYQFQIGVPDGKSNPVAAQAAQSKVALDQPTHFCGVYDPAQARIGLFINGKLQRWIPFSGKFQPSPVAFMIGCNSNGKMPPSEFFGGTVSEVRVSQVARYSGDFTPPARFEPDADTVLLYHLDEGTGDVAHDVSGHGYDGKIVAARWVPYEPADFAAERAAAEGIVALGGHLDAVYPGEPGRHHVNNAQSIPDRPFFVDYFSTYGKPCQDADLQRLHLERLRGLHYVTLGGPGQEGITAAGLQGLDGHPTLRSIQMNTMPMLGEDTLRSLAACPALERIAVYSSPGVTDASLAQLAGMKSLVELNLDNSRVGDAGLEQVARLPALRLLVLTSSKATPKGIETLRRALPQCEIVYTEVGKVRVAGPPDPPPAEPGADIDRAAAEALLRMHGAVVVVTGGKPLHVDDVAQLPPGPFQLGGAIFHFCTGLRNVDVARLGALGGLRSASFQNCEGLTAAGLKRLAAAPALRKVQTINCFNLDDEALAVLAASPLLEVVGLAGAHHISDAGLEALVSMKALKELDLHETTITDAGLAHLAKIARLQMLDLKGCRKLTAAGVAKLRAALPKCKIDWDGAGATGSASAPPLPDGRAPLGAKAEPAAPVADPERRVAEWAFGLGGDVSVTVKADDNRPEVVIHQLNMLPAGRFTVRAISFDSLKPPTGKILTDADLDRLRVLGGIARLEFLNGRGRLLTDAGMDAIADLRTLETLRCDYSQVTDAGLARLAQLKRLARLVLAGSPHISDDGLRPLATLPLASLTLHSTPLTERSAAIIAQQWPDLTHLDVPGRILTAQAAKHLAELPKLTQLGFYNSAELRDEQLAHLAALKHVQELTLNSCKNISDAGLDHLTALPSLTSLHLRKTKVTAAGVAKLQKALPDCKIEWDEPAQANSSDKK